MADPEHPPVVRGLYAISVGDFCVLSKAIGVAIVEPIRERPARCAYLKLRPTRIERTPDVVRIEASSAGIAGPQIPAAFMD